MGASASALSPERRAKLMAMSEGDQERLLKQVEELKGLGLSEEKAIERMIKEFEDAVADDWAWGMPGKDVVRRDSIYSDDDERRSGCKSQPGSNAGSKPGSVASSPAKTGGLMHMAESK
jgi:hypothetical protein